MEQCNCSGADIRSQLLKLQEQLPKGMEHCTILYKKCKKGHGWLTATNWVDFDCPTCEKERLTRERDEARKDAEASEIAGRFWYSAADRADTRLRAAVGAIEKHISDWNGHPATRDLQAALASLRSSSELISIDHARGTDHGAEVSGHVDSEGNLVIDKVVDLSPACTAPQPGVCPP